MAFKLVDQDVGNRSVAEDDGAPREFLNRIAIPVLRKLRARLNDVITASISGAFPIGAGWVTVGHGPPTIATLPGLYVDIDGGPGFSLYVYELGGWNPK